MSSHEPNPHEETIDALAARMLDGTLTEAEFAELWSVMLRDPALVERLTDHVQLHVLLAREIGSEASAIVNDPLFEELRKAVSAPAAQATHAPLDGASPLAGDGKPASAWFILPLPTALSWAVGLAAVLLLAAVFLMRGRPGDEVAQGTQVMQIGAIRLDSGTTRMALPDIGDVIVDGPADLELVSSKRMVLNSGKVRVRVTEPKGKGFVVQMRDGEVTDLGTEFALDVKENCDTKLVVFDGAVDLRLADHEGESTRLVGGEAITFGRGRELARLVSIITGSDATFRSASSPDGKEVIVDVYDNLQGFATRKFYEIVPGGLREDALAYVDRPEHEWNGIDAAGMPDYLIGADYVKPFNDDKAQDDIEISVTLSGPARLFVFYDDRLPPPAWLTEKFHNTGDKIGLDVGQHKRSVKPHQRDVGPGQSIDEYFSIWELNVAEPSTVVLGSNTTESITSSGMYGIAAVALDQDKAKKE